SRIVDHTAGAGGLAAGEGRAVARDEKTVGHRLGPLAQHLEMDLQLVAETRRREVLAGDRHPRPRELAAILLVPVHPHSDGVQERVLGVLHEDEETREVDDAAHVRVGVLDLPADADLVHGSPCAVEVRVLLRLTRFASHLVLCPTLGLFPKRLHSRPFGLKEANRSRASRARAEPGVMGVAEEHEVFLVLLLERETTPLVFAGSHRISPSEGERWQKRSVRRAGRARAWACTEENWAVAARAGRLGAGSGRLRPRSLPPSSSTNLSRTRSPSPGNGGQSTSRSPGPAGRRFCRPSVLHVRQIS